MKSTSTHFKRLFVLILFVTSISSCDFIKKLINPVEPSKDKITVGETVNIGTQSVGSSGGKMVFTKSGDMLDGLTITVADSSFTQSRDFMIEYNTIQSHKFNEYFIPISPIIKISNGGGYANRIIEVKIPVTVPAGEVPLAFFYDENTGKLEPVPILTYDATSVTVGTRHFMTSSLHSSAGSKLMNSIQTENPYSKLIISSLKESVINQQSTISSGYKPGIDDWEFVNYGSYIAPGGHCAGQTMTSMWYYYEMKESQCNLYKKYLSNPKIWQDNANGYRFASVIQNDMDWDGTYYKFQRDYIDKNQALDKMKWYIIAGAMMVTTEPQLIAIWRIKTDKDGNEIKDSDGNPVYGGHAIICYQISIADGKLYICDPNKPGLPQSINFVNNKFQPYIAMQNASAASHPYPYITYYAKTALIDWPMISNRFSEFTKGTIGTIAPNKFPAYTVWVNDGTGYELKDGLNTDLDSLSLAVFCPNAEVSFNFNNKKVIGYRIYNEDGTKIGGHGSNGPGYIKLKPGKNKIGIYIFGWRESTKDDNGVYLDNYIDFKWYNVTLESIAIETTEKDGSPIMNAGVPNKEYTFLANTKGMAPKNAKYVWDFGDKSPLETKLNDTTIKHTFHSAENFKINLKMYDNISNKLVGEANANVLMGVVTFFSYKTYKKDIEDTSATCYLEYPGNGGIYGSWNNLTYTGQYDTIAHDKSKGDYLLHVTFVVNLNTAKNTVTSFNFKMVVSGYDGSDPVEWFRVQGKDIPLSNQNNDYLFFELGGTGVRDHLVENYFIMQDWCKGDNFKWDEAFMKIIVTKP